MKALILAAGYGTRLLPYTRIIPKPLFTINDRPVLLHLIDHLIRHGCEQILVNTHHLPDAVAAAVRESPFPVRVLHEPVILNTGGAIANARVFLEDAPFFVINADIVCDADLTRVMAAHQTSNALATLVLHDCAPFNKVGVDVDGHIQSFDSFPDGLAFTGIQVLSPAIFEYFPSEKEFSSLTVYRRLIPDKKIRAFVDDTFFWSDIGTPESYKQTSRTLLAARAFGIGPQAADRIRIQPLAGDGSDRLWSRAFYENRSLILCDHGICLPGTDSLKQLQAFLDIGGHLHAKGLPVPRLLQHDTLSGMVVMEDLGDHHLETFIRHQRDPASITSMYQRVIDRLIEFSTLGIQGFRTEWTCQTPAYSKDLILEKECRYFMEAYINGYLNRNLTFDDFSDEFETIADHALNGGWTGLMHRDCQSRNIMIHEGEPFFIDFQSARTGPLQYDLASLVMDPYVDLPDEIKQSLPVYAMDRLHLDHTGRERFLNSFRYCCLTRNLQFLGAFSHLSRIGGKNQFEQYIPCAVKSLKQITAGLEKNIAPRLVRLAQTL